LYRLSVASAAVPETIRVIRIKRDNCQNQKGTLRERRMERGQYRPCIGTNSAALRLPSHGTSQRRERVEAYGRERL
jgi:hypothetical protein